MTPLVSVVIPSYQQADYIDEAVRSVLEQDVDLELVIADHSSTDGTWDRLQQYAGDPRVALSRTPAGGGAPANWRAVTARARGVYLKLLPGDDTLQPGSLARQVALLEAHPHAVLTAGLRDVIDASGKVVVRARGLNGLVGAMPGTDAIRATIRSGTNLFGEPGAVLMRRAALESAGGWDDAHPYAIDEATYIRVLEQGDFVPDPAPASTFRLSGGQWSVALARSQAQQMARLHADVAERLPDAVSAADVRRGNRRAYLLAQQRRIVYLVLKGRMR